MLYIFIQIDKTRSPQYIVQGRNVLHKLLAGYQTAEDKLNEKPNHKVFIGISAFIRQSLYN